MPYYLNPVTGRFPMTVADIMEANPNTSYSKGATAFDGYMMIADPVEPAYNKGTQRLVLLPPGSWTVKRGLRMVTTKHPMTGVETTEEKMMDISSTWAPSADGKYAQTYRIDPMSAQEIADIAADSIASANAASNVIIHAALAAADLKIIRALSEGDTARINTHKAAQATLRAQLR